MYPIKKKIIYIISNIDKALAFEWIADRLNPSLFEVSFIILNNGKPYLQNYLEKKGITSFYIQYSGKKDFPGTFLKIYKILKRINPDIIHTHLFEANLIGLGSAYLLKIPRRIHTRHHSNFHHDYFPQAVKYDKIINFFSTDIIAISKLVKSVLLKKENVPATKVNLIHHGFDLEKFSHGVQADLIELRNKYSVSENFHPVIGVISRYVELKGIQYIIPAFKKLQNDYPNAHLILANATGPDKEMIRKLLSTLLKNSYTEIPFEPDLFALYQLFDIFVHTPINAEIEAFGQVYVEALAAGIPSVFTLSGVAHEFIEHEKNALIADYKNSEQIYLGMKKLIQDEKLKTNLILNGKKSVMPFNLSDYINSLEKLYLQEKLK